MGYCEDIAEKVIGGRAKEVVALIEQALAEGEDPEDLLTKGLMAGMNVIGEKFKLNEVFVPEVLVAARAMNKGMAVLKPALAKAGAEPLGKAVICTVKGDMHDIGKNLVKMMIEGRGIECIDLGTDVDAERVVRSADRQTI